MERFQAVMGADAMAGSFRAAPRAGGGLGGGVAAMPVGGGDKGVVLGFGDDVEGFHG